jgi:hypothetical protein
LLRHEEFDRHVIIAGLGCNGSRPFARQKEGTIMPLRSATLIATIVFATFVVTAAVRAGVVVHVADQSVPTGAQSPREVYYAQDGLLRIDKLDDEGHVAEITLIRDGALWQIDVPKRTYRKLDKAAMQVRKGAMNDKMQAMLAQMPPERRALLEQRMKSMQQPADLTWSDVGRSETSGSYSCHVWELRRNDKPTQEYCVTPAASLPGGDELATSLRQAGAVATEVFSGTGASQAVAQRLAVFTKMNGFPVVTRDMAGGKASHERRVTSVEHTPLAADKFAIPAGFTTAPDTAAAQ